MAAHMREERIAVARQELSDHHNQQTELLDAFSLALNHMKSTDPQGFIPYYDFMKCAYFICDAEVRRFDIISWYKAADRAALDTVSRLQDYYHKEARLTLRVEKLRCTVSYAVRRDLTELQGDDGADAMMTFDAAVGMPEWCWEDTYAVALDEHSPRFGYEIERPGRGAVDLRYPESETNQEMSRILEIFANFEARLVRIQYANSEERFGAAAWPESVDSRVVEPVEEAIKPLPESRSELRARMQDCLKGLNDRRREIWELHVLRRQEEVLVKATDNTESSDTMRAHIRNVRSKICVEVERLGQKYGRRAEWDWEQ
ncbi:hypothetical protein LTR78_009667 [Recurvomyces mirabilis]|uniref:Uncharacterized protein n=2 Tax=Recurvomyces mirabilis TaxID=574656 RepID=A0AAE0TNF6_9PEZI|nr:hypothetical protein LTR78_009667 [Recurvomyces mirabilis]